MKFTQKTRCSTVHGTTPTNSPTGARAHTQTVGGWTQLRSSANNFGGIKAIRKAQEEKSICHFDERRELCDLAHIHFSTWCCKNCDGTGTAKLLRRDLAERIYRLCRRTCSVLHPHTFTLIVKLKKRYTEQGHKKHKNSSSNADLSIWDFPCVSRFSNGAA